jgi:hypothetical protein
VVARGDRSGRPGDRIRRFADEYRAGTFDRAYVRFQMELQPLFRALASTNGTEFMQSPQPGRAFKRALVDKHRAQATSCW